MNRTKIENRGPNEGLDSQPPVTTSCLVQGLMCHGVVLTNRMFSTSLSSLSEQQLWRGLPRQPDSAHTCSSMQVSLFFLDQDMYDAQRAMPICFQCPRSHFFFLWPFFPTSFLCPAISVVTYGLYCPQDRPSLKFSAVVDYILYEAKLKSAHWWPQLLGPT